MRKLTYLEQVERTVYSITRFYHRRDINDILSKYW